jgi:hypothetical protein
MSRTIKEIPAPHRQVLSFLLSHFHNKMMMLGLPYWLEGGALLGFHRNGKFIPHDDDLDLCMNFHDMNTPAFREVLDYMATLSASIPAEENMPERIEKVIVKNEAHLPMIVKIAVPNMWCQFDDGSVVGTPTMDIFPMELKKKTYRLRSLLQRRQFPNCYFLENEVFPLKIAEIEGVKCFVPNNGLPYLLRYYGQDCLQVVRVEERDGDNPLKKKYKN